MSNSIQTVEFVSGYSTRYKMVGTLWSLRQLAYTFCFELRARPGALHTKYNSKSRCSIKFVVHPVLSCLFRRVAFRFDCTCRSPVVLLLHPSCFTLLIASNAVHALSTMKMCMQPASFPWCCLSRLTRLCSSQYGVAPQTWVSTFAFLLHTAFGTSVQPPQSMKSWLNSLSSFSKTFHRSFHILRSLG